MLQSSSGTLRFSLGIALILAAIVGPSHTSWAQDDETPVEEMTPEEKQQKAIGLFQEGEALAQQEEFEGAVAKYKEAYELFPDPGLLVKIGEALQRDGTAQRDFEKLAQAVEHYKKYVEAVPEGPTTDAVNERIQQLEESIRAEEERKQRVADEEKQAALDEKLAREAEERDRLQREQEKKEMQIVLAGGLLAGADQDFSGILRFSGGALLSWEHFAIEGKFGIDGFLRVNADKGVQARSFTLADIGVRYALNYKLIGPFFTGGASFGLFTGEPRERKLVDDTDSCGGGDCAIDIDKNIVGRLGFGYGFAASDKSTVAFKVELQNWFFSVADEQGIGNPSAGDIAKPQTSFALMVGLEFLRWL